jgi:N-acetylmuramoyl-L-alanine amidase
VELIERAVWGAKHGRGTELRGERVGVVLHHFAAPHLDCGVSQEAERRAIRGVEDYHTTTNGWAGIGYHFVACQSGRVYEGRGWERTGAHAKGRNSTTYGIALAIDGAKHEPTDAAIEAVRWVIEMGVKLGYIAQQYTLEGHRDVGGTTCPGDLVYARLGEFRP